MKKVIAFQKENYKHVEYALVSCFEFGAGSTYKAKLNILFFLRDGTMKSFSYKYSLKNIYRFLNVTFIPYKLDKRVVFNLQNNDIKRF